MSKVKSDHKYSALLLREWNINLVLDNGSHKAQSQANYSSISEILFNDVPYNILLEQPQIDVAPKRLTLEEFYQENRLLLPVGIRSIFRAWISQTTALPLPSLASQQPQRTLSYRDTKNAVEILNPWFHYTEIFHQCRTEYDLCHRSIDMLSTQSLNKDSFRELLVLLYGQKFMFKAPDLFTEFHFFISNFRSKFKDQPQQIWIDLKRLNETYGNRTGVVDDANITQRHPFVGSLSTIPQSNKSLKKEKIILQILIEV